MNTRRHLLIGVFHIASWAIILLLLTAIWREHAHHRATEALSVLFEQSAGKVIPLAEEANDYRMERMELMTDAYPKPESRRYRTKADTAKRLYDSCQQMLSGWLEYKSPEADFNASAVLDSFWNRLFFLSEGNTWVEESFDRSIWPENDGWGPDWQRRLFQDVSPAERKSLIRSLALRNVMAWHYFMNYIASNTTYDLRFDEFEPMLVSGQINPFAGQPYEADIFLTRTKAYRPRNGPRFWVNDQEIRRHKLLYEATFSRPGPHPLRLRAEVRDPFTGQIKTYQRDYTLNVRPKN